MKFFEMREQRKTFKLMKYKVNCDELFSHFPIRSDLEEFPLLDTPKMTIWE